MSGKPVRIQGRYSAAPPVAADGEFPYLLLDASGAIIVSPSAAIGVTLFDSGADVTELVASAAAATLLSVFGFNNSANQRYVHIFDAAALPAPGTPPDWAPISVPTVTNFALVFAKGFAAANGVVIASSSTYATLTITGAADMWISGEML